jgi:hypothetical protein
VVNKALLFALLAWMPLFVLWLVAGMYQTADTSLFSDLPTYSRFLLAVPLLILAENFVDDRFALIAAYFPNSLIINEIEKGRYFRLMDLTARLCDSWVGEAVLGLLAYALSALSLIVDLNAGPSSSWRVGESGQGISLAAWWYVLVSMPLFYFLLLRWAWRFVIWCIYLFRLSRLDLDLVPTHPDESGGLGILSESIYAFTPIILASASVMASVWGMRVLHHGAQTSDFHQPFLIFVVFFLLVSAGPLLIFTRKLLQLKLRGLHDYGMLANRLSLQFDSKWIRQIEKEEDRVLGTPDISSLADLGTSYQTVSNLRCFPFGLWNLVPVAAASLIPMIPLVLTEIPLSELIKKVAGALI